MKKTRLMACMAFVNVSLAIGFYFAITEFNFGKITSKSTQVDAKESKNSITLQSATIPATTNTEFTAKTAAAITNNLTPLKNNNTRPENISSKVTVTPLALHLKVQLEVAAVDFVNAQSTAFSENYTRSITKTIVQDAPQLKAIIETFQSFALLEKSFGERQAEFRVLAAAVLAELSNHPTQRPLLLNTVNAISHEIEVSGNQKRRTLDLEDAVMALCESFQPAELEQAFESHFSKIYFSKTTVVPIKLALRECAEKLNQPESVIAKISKQFTLKKSDNKDET